jgi:hypothetical protein
MKAINYYKEIEEDLRRLKDLTCSCISSINIAKITIAAKAICNFSAIPIKIPRHSLQR